MPRQKKTARDMTTEELAKKLFPKKVRDKLREIAHEKDKRGEKSDSNSSS